MLARVIEDLSRWTLAEAALSVQDLLARISSTIPSRGFPLSLTQVLDSSASRDAANGEVRWSGRDWDFGDCLRMLSSPRLAALHSPVVVLSSRFVLGRGASKTGARAIEILEITAGDAWPG